MPRPMEQDHVYSVKMDTKQYEIWLREKDIVKEYPNFDLEIALRALRVIEGLTFEDIVMLPKEKIEEIYTYAHVGGGYCENPHPEWRKRLAEAEEALIKAGIIDPYCEERQ